MIRKEDIIYLFGPISGLPDANRKAFDAAEKYLTKSLAAGF